MSQTDPELITLQVDDSGRVFCAGYEPPKTRRDVLDVADFPFKNTQDVLSMTEEEPAWRHGLRLAFVKGIGVSGTTEEQREELWEEHCDADLDEKFVGKWLKHLKSKDLEALNDTLSQWLDEPLDWYDEEQVQDLSPFPRDSYEHAYGLLDDAESDVSKAGIKLVDGDSPDADRQIAKLRRPIEEVNKACEKKGIPFRFEKANGSQHA